MDEQESTFLDDIEDGDFIFVVDSDGNLRSYAMPEFIESEHDFPDNIKKIMKIFKNQAKMTQQTLH